MNPGWAGGLLAGYGLRREIFEAGCLRILSRRRSLSQPSFRNGPVGRIFEDQDGTKSYRRAPGGGGLTSRPPHGLWRHDETGMQMRWVPDSSFHGCRVNCAPARIAAATVQASFFWMSSCSAMTIARAIEEEEAPVMQPRHAAARAASRGSRFSGDVQRPGPHDAQFKVLCGEQVSSVTGEKIHIHSAASHFLAGVSQHPAFPCLGGP